MTQRNKIRQLRGIERSSQKIQNRLQEQKHRCQTTLFNKELIDQLQSELINRHGYQLARSSIPILSMYFEHYDLLKQVITQKHSQKFKNNRFVTEYNRYYSEEKVSQLLQQISNKNKQFKKVTIYRQQCLLKYFEFDKFSKSSVVKTLLNKIQNSKAEGFIKYEVKRSRKREHTFFPIIEKQNKVKNFQFYSSPQTRKNITDRQNRVSYEILSLKLLLDDNNPDPMETNKVCEQIKFQLQNLFNTIRIKPAQQIKKKSLLCL